MPVSGAQKSAHNDERGKGRSGKFGGVSRKAGFGRDDKPRHRGQQPETIQESPLSTNVLGLPILWREFVGMAAMRSSTKRATFVGMPPFAL